jgi:hypothetical protein
MKRIAVLHRVGHQRADDAEAEACLVSLHRGGISAHIDKPEEQYNIYCGLKMTQISAARCGFFERTASK